MGCEQSDHQVLFQFGFVISKAQILYHRSLNTRLSSPQTREGSQQREQAGTRNHVGSFFPSQSSRHWAGWRKLGGHLSGFEVRILRHCFLIFLVAFAASISIPAYSKSKRPAPTPTETRQPPKPESEQSKQDAATEQRGTENFPVFVKIVPAQNLQNQPAKGASKENGQPSPEWWTVYITGALALIGFMQTIVFGLQARRLKQTIEAMKKIATDQSKDMHGWISVADKASVPMEIKSITSCLPNDGRLHQWASVICYGQIRYADASGYQYISNFCYAFDRSSLQFYAVGGAAHNSRRKLTAEETKIADERDRPQHPSAPSG